MSKNYTIYLLKDEYDEKPYLINSSYESAQDFFKRNHNIISYVVNNTTSEIVMIKNIDIRNIKLN